MKPQVSANIEDVRFVASTLENIYWNGFKERCGPFKIKRRTLLQLLPMGREAVTLESVLKRLRQGRFSMFAVDTVIKPLSAKEWIIERRDIEEIPVVTAAVMRRAERRAKSSKE